jgi:hypothetical protein
MPADIANMFSKVMLHLVTLKRSGYLEQCIRFCSYFNCFGFLYRFQLFTLTTHVI